MKLPANLKGRKGVVIDTSVFIYCFEDHPEFGNAAAFVLQQAEAGAFHGVITPITAAELLVKPLRAGRADLADRYRSVLASLPNIEFIALDDKIGFMAGALRAQYGLPLPDMLQVAAAMVSPSPAIITNDRAWKRITDVRVVLLEDVRG